MFLNFRGGPDRNIASKYYLSSEEYAFSNFPLFTHGRGYGISRAAIHDLYISALKQEYFKLEDVFIAGIVAQLMHIERIHAYEHYNRRMNVSIEFDTKNKICNLRKTYTIHGITPSKQYDLWMKFKNTNIKC